VEALAEGEGLPTNATDCAAQQGNWNEASHCIRTGFESVVCKFNGKIVAFGVELSGAYEKGKKYNIPWAEYSCVASTGNCCVKQGLYSGETKLA